MATYFIYLLLFFINIQFSFTNDELTDTFEFGVNVGKVSFSTSGSIGNLRKDKVTTIPITVVDCSEITYIRVDVRNKISPPFVKFDSNINAVIIKYRKSQFSISNYVIVAKTKRVPCDNSNYGF